MSNLKKLEFYDFYMDSVRIYATYRGNEPRFAIFLEEGENSTQLTRLRAIQLRDFLTEWLEETQEENNNE